jgi:hypothetical protein
MANELATIDKHESAPLVRYGRPLLTVESLTEEGQQRQLLMKYVQAHMVEGTDFGVIPGTKNRTLLKPGAEKLTDLFRCTAEFTIAERVEDWDRPLIHYVFRCRIVSRETGGVVAEGFGSCNSHESKYRYRNETRKCPACGSPTILKSKYPPKNNKNAPPGFYCYAAKGGCGAEFAHDDKTVTAQTLGKVENPDVADVANTILKMAKKRAHVDAAIAMARCSDMFTQDVEDEPEYHPPARTERPVTVETVAPRGGQHLPADTPRGGQHTSPPVVPATPLEQLKADVSACLRANRMTYADMIAWLNEQGGTNYSADTKLGSIPPEDVQCWITSHTTA